MQSLQQLMEERLKKLEKLKKMGLNPFEITKYERNSTAKELHERFDEKIKPNEKLPEELFSIAGRVMAKRIHGKACFIDVEDASGKIQIFLDESTLKENYKLLDLIDIGDILGVKGFVFKTARGELTIWTNEFKLLSKALRPLPSKWYGLKDADLRHRKRYLDLIMNKKSKEVFIKRAKIIKAMREFLDSRGFIEVETPILQPIYGGAFARPFITHHNALDIDLYLRIAPELYLKRLIVGGLERVYEIGKDFRNEGIDTRHNPEFTMMECYQAYANYLDMAKLTEEMISTIAEKVLGTTKIEYQGQKIDLKPPWKRITMKEALLEKGIDVSKSKEELLQLAKEKGLEVNENFTKGDLINEFFEELIEPELIQPTFVLDYPVEISPLAKRKPNDPNFTERFEGFIAGMEIANAFSELNDPIDQRQRFLEQAKRRKLGLESEPFDEDFIEALEYGMPPTGGLGIGVDRIVMILTNTPSIRDVIAFPTLRPKK